jgi:hypothetical protein
MENIGRKVLLLLINDKFGISIANKISKKFIKALSYGQLSCMRIGGGSLLLLEHMRQQNHCKKLTSHLNF